MHSDLQHGEDVYNCNGSPESFDTFNKTLEAFSSELRKFIINDWEKWTKLYIKPETQEEKLELKKRKYLMRMRLVAVVLGNVLKLHFYFPKRWQKHCQLGIQCA